MFGKWMLLQNIANCFPISLGSCHLRYPDRGLILEQNLGERTKLPALFFYAFPPDLVPRIILSSSQILLTKIFKISAPQMNRMAR